MDTIGNIVIKTTFWPLVELLGEDEFNAILEDQEALTNILLYHVVGAEVFAEDVVELDGESVDSLLEDDPISITIDEDGNVFVDGAQVIIVDVEASNGVIHIINAAIVPDGM